MRNSASYSSNNNLIGENLAVKNKIENVLEKINAEVESQPYLPSEEYIKVVDVDEMKLMNQQYNQMRLELEKSKQREAKLRDELKHMVDPTAGQEIESYVIVNGKLKKMSKKRADEIRGNQDHKRYELTDETKEYIKNIQDDVRRRLFVNDTERYQVPTSPEEDGFLGEIPRFKLPRPVADHDIL